MLVLIILISFIWFAYWGAESGASLPWSSEWQDKWSFGSEIPEIIISLSVAIIATYGLGKLIDLSWYLLGAISLVYVVIAYIGKQSGTWAYLTWESHVNRNPDRQSTLRPWNDFVAGLFGWQLGDEGYSWVWAATKGFIMTLPLGGTGLIFHPIGHEIGSHAEGRLSGDRNMWKELSASGFCYAGAIAVFLGVL